MPKSTAVNITYNLECRSKDDDAWYVAGVIFENGNRLRVKFRDFQESYFDEVFSTADFSNQDDFDEFIGIPVEIEDHECRKVIQGMTVCAEYEDINDGSLRYFNAIVDDVYYKEHMPEKCVCKYSLFWQRGPEEGNITAATLDHIWIINMTSHVDPIVSEFAKLVEGKLGGVSMSSYLSRKTNPNAYGGAGKNSDFKLSEGRERLCYELRDDDRDIGGFKELEIERFCYELSDDDRDTGGFKELGCHHYIILENLEKDLCPMLMMQFIHEQTSITSQAYIFPNLSVETYARGSIMVDSSSNLKRIYDFINNPNHCIVSLSGRPWVIAEEMLKTGTFNPNLQNLQPRFKSPSQNMHTGRKLTVVQLGTDEFRRAKQLKDLFIEYRNHLNGLARRLEMEEKKTQHPSTAN